MALVELKTAVESDWGTISSLMEEFCQSGGLPFNFEFRRQSYDSLLLNPELGEVWKINVDKEVSGYIILTFGFSFEYGRDAFIDELFVKKEFRGQGIGTLALDHATEQSKTFGVNVLHLEVEKTNMTAARLYEKMGFKAKDRYLMSKNLI